MKSVSTLLLTLTFTSLVVAQAAVFAPINGVYNGLFFETNGYWQQSSGSINITTTSRGRYTARLQIGPKRYSFSGQFDADGRVDRQVLRYYDNPLTVRFQVDSDDPDLIVGSVSDGTWTSDLFADRAVFNGRSSISPDTGQYTMAILGDFTSTNNPGGISVGTIAVDKAGRVRFAA